MVSTTSEEGLTAQTGETPKPKKKDRFIALTPLAYVAFTANLGSFLFGYDFGATSWLLTSIDRYSTDADDVNYTYFYEIANSSGLTGLIAAGSAIGATLTYTFLLFFGNSIPKRDEIQLAALLYFIGALLESESGDLSWATADGLSLLLVGRFVYGAGIATSFHAVPQYISELTPPELRGMVGSSIEAMVVTGVFIGYIVGYCYSDDEDSWIVTFRIGYIIAVVMGLFSLFIPQSPSWMIRNKIRKDEILEALTFIQVNAGEEELQALESAFEEETRTRQKWEIRWNKQLESMDSSGNGVSSNASNNNNNCGCDCCGQLFKILPPELKLLFSETKLTRCLLLALTLVMLQIFTGQSAILYFAGDVFDQICPSDPDDCILGLGIAKLVPAYVMIFFADSLGRRVYLLGGSVAMLIGMVILCYGFGTSQEIPSLVGIYLAVAGFEFSFGTMLWILLSEIFPQFVRSAANSISVATLFTWSAILTFALPYVEDAAGLLDIFIFFTCSSAVSVIILYFFAPETRGTNIEQAYKLVDESYKRTIAQCGCHAEEDESDNMEKNSLLLEQEDR